MRFLVVRTIRAGGLSVCDRLGQMYELPSLWTPGRLQCSTVVHSDITPYGMIDLRAWPISQILSLSHA